MSPRALVWSLCGACAACAPQIVNPVDEPDRPDAASMDASPSFDATFEHFEIPDATRSVTGNDSFKNSAP